MEVMVSLLGMNLHSLLQASEREEWILWRFEGGLRVSGGILKQREL
jgi:hypothetical protein